MRDAVSLLSLCASDLDLISLERPVDPAVILKDYEWWPEKAQPAIHCTAPRSVQTGTVSVQPLFHLRRAAYKTSNVA